ncbi:uncharacterized protein LOC143143978 [Ptiloglossa arizonensis]|uniref:uncharacterized protein LOC143143978 n=1 Tax=Ptiloglossa arizonensis TaxID=3350558 RepID=UPI003F9FFA2F
MANRWFRLGLIIDNLRGDDAAGRTESKASSGQRKRVDRSWLHAAEKIIYRRKREFNEQFPSSSLATGSCWERPWMRLTLRTMVSRTRRTARREVDQLPHEPPHRLIRTRLALTPIPAGPERRS